MRRYAERQSLRDSLSVDDSSPLRRVKIRNDHEHLDERIERWWDTSPNPNFVGLVVGPRENRWWFCDARERRASLDRPDKWRRHLLGQRAKHPQRRPRSRANPASRTTRDAEASLGKSLPPVDEGGSSAADAARLGKAGPHDLRRSFCSLAARRGVDPAQASPMRGYSLDVSPAAT